MAISTHTLPPKPKLSRIRRREEWVAYLLISPWLFGFVVFILGPMLASLGLSFLETDMFSWKYVGLKNYTTLFSFDQTRSLFWTTLYNTAYYVILAVPLTMMIGFSIALLLNQNIRGQSFYRMVYYLPAIIPGIAVSMIWIYLFQPEFGVINWLLSLIGIEGPRWLFDSKTAKLVLVTMSMWGAGGNMLIFLAGLQGVPTELYEAATIDGATAWHRLRHITLPLISPTFFFVLITELIFAFQIFVSVYVMTGGGPANSTMMYVLHLYLVAFRQFRFGFASALAWVLFLILLALTLLIIRSSSLWVHYETEIGGGKE